VDRADAAERVTDLKRRLGQRLADLRKVAGATQRDLARYAFIHRSYVSHAERGQQMPERTFWAAADDYLQAGGHLLAAYDELATAQHNAKQAELDALRARHLALSEDQMRGSVRQLDAEAMRCELVNAFGLLLADQRDTAATPDLSLTATHTVQAMEAFSGHDLVNRRHVLHQLSVLTGGALLRPVQQWMSLLPVVPVGVGVSAAELDGLEEAVKLFRRRDRVRTGGPAAAAMVSRYNRKAVIGQLKAVTETVVDTSSSALRRKLFHIMAELAELAGWMSFDQDLPGAAQRYYLLALHASREANAPLLAAKVIGNIMKLSIASGHYRDSLSVARVGMYALQGTGKENALVRAELLGLEAFAHAELGLSDAPDAVRAAETSVAVWHEHGGEPSPDWLAYMAQPAEVECLAVNAYTQLALSANDRRGWQHYANQAETHMANVRAARNGHYLLSQILDEVRMANIRLAQREPIEAATVASQALTLAEQVHSSILCDRLVRFQGELASRYATLPAAGDLTQRLRDYLGRAAPGREEEMA
jgi:transcriptional regulator with XRE-family HTH domain